MHGAGIDRPNTTKGRWMTHPIEGEAAYNWGSYKIQPVDSPNDTLSDPNHRDFLIDTIRNLHCSALGWIANYDQSNPVAQVGAEEVQKAFGYRFILEKFSFSPVVRKHGRLVAEFSIKNSGSAPFYEDWPVYLNLLDSISHRVMWRQEMKTRILGSGCQATLG